MSSHAGALRILTLSALLLAGGCKDSAPSSKAAAPASTAVSPPPPPKPVEAASAPDERRKPPPPPVELGKMLTPIDEVGIAGGASLRYMLDEGRNNCYAIVGTTESSRFVPSGITTVSAASCKRNKK